MAVKKGEQLAAWAVVGNLRNHMSVASLGSEMSRTDWVWCRTQAVKRVLPIAIRNELPTKIVLWLVIVLLLIQTYRFVQVSKSPLCFLWN
jgi:hypothetical protein